MSFSTTLYTDGVVSSRVMPIASVVVFAAAFVLSLVDLLPHSDVPVAAYQDAMKYVDLRPGDRLLVHPPWRHDVLDALGPRATTALSAPHGSNIGRVWLLDGGGALPRARERQIQSRVHQGDVDVYLLGGSASSKARLDSAIADATVVVIDKGGQRTECHFDAARNRHICPGLPEWMYVGPYEMTSGEDTQRCLWAHPITGGQVSIAFAPQILPARLTLRHAFKTRVAKSGATVDATVFVDGRRVGKSTRTLRSGFSAQRFAIGESESPRSVRVVVETENDGARHYCFSLELDDG